jgi:hydrogenase nickel incorporation protein HypB
VKVVLARDLLKVNADLAAENRRAFERQGVTVINLIGSPGAGKTTLLEKSLPFLTREAAVAVVEGDIATTRDAERIERLGVPVVQINTGGSCHLDAQMVASAVAELPMTKLDLVLVENVGNLVCPAAFDLGEQAKVAVLSVTEGNDKPAKYPRVFREAAAVIITKADLIPHTDFDLAFCRSELAALGSQAQVFVTSAAKEQGFAEWAAWLLKVRRGWRGVPGHSLSSCRSQL